MNISFRASRMQKLRREMIGSEAPLSRTHPLALAARQILDQARLRSHFLPGVVFEDPQWLMMLDLFVAAEEGREVSVSSLCCASGVPPTTALRHIRHLQGQGIFERISHPNDRRISLVRLADAARGQIARYLMAITPRIVSGGTHSTPGANF